MQSALRGGRSRLGSQISVDEGFSSIAENPRLATPGQFSSDVCFALFGVTMSPHGGSLAGSAALESFSICAQLEPTKVMDRCLRETPGVMHAYVQQAPSCSQHEAHIGALFVAKGRRTSPSVPR